MTSNNINTMTPSSPSSTVFNIQNRLSGKNDKESLARIDYCADMQGKISQVGIGQNYYAIKLFQAKYVQVDNIKTVYWVDVLGKIRQVDIGQN